MYKSVLASLKEMPDLSNKYYFWRAIRLATALTFTGVWAQVLGLNAFESAALFSSTLYLTIIDMSASVAVRLKMLLITLVCTITVGVTTIALQPYPMAMYLLIPILVVLSLFGARLFPARNLFISINLLAFVFALPFTANHISLAHFAGYQLVGGLWYFSTVVFGLAIFKTLQWAHSGWANYFYLDESYAFTANEHFITPKAEIKRLIQEEKQGEVHLVFQHPFRLIVSLLLGYTYILLFPSAQEYWVLLTIIFVHHPSKKINASIPRITQRFLGTLVGIALFWPLTRLAAPYWLWWVFTFAFSVPIFLFIRNNYFIAITFITLLVMSNIAASRGVGYAVLQERALDTVVGIAIVLASHLLIRGIKIASVSYQRQH